MKNSALIKIFFILVMTSFLCSQDTNESKNVTLDTNLKSVEDVDKLIKQIDEDKNHTSSDMKNEDDYNSSSGAKFYTKFVSLKETIERVLRSSKNIKSSVENVIQQEQDFENAYSAYYPKITASASSAAIDKTENSNPQKNAETTYKVTLDQNIYEGGATEYNYKKNQQKLIAVTKKHKSTIEKEINKAIQAYMGVVFEKEAFAAHKRNMDKLNEIMEIVWVKYDSGAVKLGDLSAIKAGVSNAKTKLIRTESKYKDALQNYTYVVGRLAKNELLYENNISIILDSLVNTIDKAFANNSLYMADMAALKAKEYEHKTARSKWLPSIDFKLAYTDLDNSGDIKNESQELNAMLKVSYDIYNGGKRENDIVKAKSDVSEIYYSIEEKKRKLRWDVKKLHNSVLSLTNAIMSTKMELEANRQMVGSYWDEFKLGSKDLQKLLLAQNQLNTTELDYVKYRQTRVIDYFKLLMQTGGVLEYFDIAFYSKMGYME